MNREKLCDAGYEESVVFENPDYDSAIVGVTEDERVVYNFYKMIDHLMETKGMSRQEALAFLEYNTIRALPYAGDGAPIIMFSLEDLQP